MKSDKPSVALLVFAGVITCLTWPLAATLWFPRGEKALGISVFGLGLSLGPCLAAYAIVPKVRKQRARRVVLLIGGLSIMAFSLLGAVNLDMEGFFALVFAGTMGAAIGHNLVTVNAAILQLTSRFSLLRMSASGHLCNACGACSQVCPMDIDVAKSAALGHPVASGDCILCQRCAHACPTGALGLTVGLGMARRTPFIFHA
jgi:ferredoxin